MSILGDKLGPILFQFPYYAKRANVTEDGFLHRLKPFLESLPKDGFRYAVEVRNKQWVNPYLFEILHDHNVALTLIDHPWMATADQLFHRKGVVTTDFSYIRWLGDRKGIEKLTTTWNETVFERKDDLEMWVPHIQSLIEKKVDVFGYVNNHYAGYSPENVDQLKRMLND